MRPLIDEGPWLDEYGWMLSVCYHIVFMVMFTRLMFSGKRKQLKIKDLRAARAAGPLGWGVDYLVLPKPSG